MESKPTRKDVTYNIFMQYCKKDYRPWFTYLYFPVSYPLSFILFRLGLTANGISFLGIIIALVGAWYIFAGQLMLGLILLLVSYLFDFCDGNVARVEYNHLGVSKGNGRQQLGLLYENLYANISYFLLFTSVGYYLFTTTGDHRFFLIGVFAGGLKVINRYTIIHMCLLNKKERGDEEGKPAPVFSSSNVNQVKYFFTKIVDNARLYFISMIVVAAIWPDFFPYFFAGYMCYVILINFTKLLLTLIRRQP